MEQITSTKVEADERPDRGIDGAVLTLQVGDKGR
jgi:hypothetical protein